MTQDQIIYLVDDDHSIRESLEDLFASENVPIRSFATASDYLGFQRQDVASCLLLDLELPDIGGLELQTRLADEGEPPIVFLTGHGDVGTTARAFKAGAVDFLTKPYHPAALLKSVSEALRIDRERRAARTALLGLRARFSALTPREREVLPLVISGLLNKQAAALLGISEITLQIHRANLMRKLGADSLPALVRMADSLGVPVTHSRRPIH